MGQKQNRETTLNGIIIAARMDEQYNAVSIMIATDDEEDYTIVKNDIGKELFYYLSTRVKLTGTVKENFDGTKRVIVKKYDIISYP